jgi:hypothetical protein
MDINSRNSICEEKNTPLVAGWRLVLKTFHVEVDYTSFKYFSTQIQIQLQMIERD